MAEACTHLDTVADVVPSADGCEDCLRTSGRWVHLRLCMACGHVGCCDNSANRHATAHWREHPGHPLIRSFEPGENWRRGSPGTWAGPGRGAGPPPPG